MSRLPVPGSDNGTWGTLLNDFLGVEHNSDGTLKDVLRPAQRGAANGVASLDGSSFVPLAQIPDLSTSYAPLPASPTALSIYTRNAANNGYIWSTSSDVIARSLNWLVVTDKAWGSDPFGTNGVAACAAATSGQTVYFPTGTYTPPAGVGNGFTVMADNVTLVFAPGVTVNITTWGACGIDLYNRSGCTVRGRPTIVYTGTRGTHTGATYRGSAPYVNGCGVYCNRDRTRIEGLRTIGMPLGVFFSSWNGTSASDRAGVGNMITDLESEGCNWGVLWVGQQGLRIHNLYVHDDIDDSSGANPTHAYYCSASTALHCTDLLISNALAKNILGGQAFQLKFCDNVRLVNHAANNCKGLLNLIDTNDLQSDNMGITNSLANSGQGAITVQQSANICKRVVLNNTTINAATGVDERMVRINASDSEVSDMLILTNRPASPASLGDYEFIVTGDNSRYKNVTIRSRGPGHVRAFCIGYSTPCTNVSVENFLCENTIGLVDVYTGGTGIVVKYDPALQLNLVAGSNYVGTLGGPASFVVARSEYERLYTVNAGNASPRPNPYTETRALLNIADSAAITIGVPFGGTPPLGTTLDVVVTNSSGGTLGAISWNAAYTLLTSYVKPLSGASTYHKFRHNGSGWVEMAPNMPTTSGAPPDIQTFTTTGTWAKPTNAQTVRVVCIGGGGGGGSGRSDASGTVRCGGGGGAGASLTQAMYPADALPATVAVVVGTGGAGGAAVTTDATSGNAGSAGGSSAFNVYARSGGGSGGAGGTASSGTGGAGALNGGFAGFAGANASTVGAVGNTGTSAGFSGPGGGSGGGIGSSGETATAGGAGGVTLAVQNTAATAGTAGGGTGGNGLNSATADAAVPGAAGAGGGSATSGAGGAGGNAGTYGAAGGGGGASANGNNSGAGGNGAAGVVQIITTF